MVNDLTFLMGKHPAPLPGRLRYARNHMWCQAVEGRLRFGFSAYAVRLMRDVYFLDWSVSPGVELLPRQEIGHIETSKAESDLYAPLAGTLLGFNEDLLEDPTAINTDTYGAGWLFEMSGDFGAALTATEYYQYLDANWENTQRLLKGHL
jgi:glycine cleavage system H protein